MKNSSKLALLIALIFFISCDNKETLQEYYVDNQGNQDFVAIDVPTSMFASSKGLEPKEQETLETIKKINVLAVPKRTANQEKIDSERTKILDILKDEKYQLLMKYGGGDRKLEMYYTGTDDAINEIVVYGYDSKKGVGIARILGDNMNPADIGELIRNLNRGSVNMNGLQGIVKMFSDSSVAPGKVKIQARDSIGLAQDSIQ
ncbi:MAG: DUF4252 domain-containing protein [Gillisia sp.]